MAEATELSEIYTRYIKPLSPADRRRLLALVTHDLAQGENGSTSRGRSLLELEGLGAEIWQGIDAQTYVRTLRDEWERDP
jgi:hypothetical protein